MAEEQEFKLKRVKRLTLNQHVYENIKQSILNGDLPPNAKLSEVQMGRQLGVSATPVREAFRMLAMEGLVRIDPWKGAVVQGFSERAALETEQCREALETMAMRLFIARMRAEDLNAARYMIESARDAQSVSDFVKISSALHDIWIEGCGNSRLAALVCQLNEVLLRERNVSANDAVRKREIIDEHQSILVAMIALDADGASEALSRHIKNGYEYSLRHEGEHGGTRPAGPSAPPCQQG